MPRLAIGRYCSDHRSRRRVVASFLLDWSANHLLNPAWPGHANSRRLGPLSAGRCLLPQACWPLWRDSKEPQVGIKAAAAISASFSGSRSSTSRRSILPGSTAWAGNPAAIPTLAGHVFLPNLAVAAGFLALTVLGEDGTPGYRLTQRRRNAESAYKEFSAALRLCVEAQEIVKSALTM